MVNIGKLLGQPVLFEYSKNKKITLRYKPRRKAFIAEANAISIKIDDLFDKLSIDKKRAIIWHELYHYRYNSFALPALFVKNIFFKGKYNADQLLEFRADSYSAKNNGRDSMISALKFISKLVGKGAVNYNTKNHPSIKDRINKLREL